MASSYEIQFYFNGEWTNDVSLLGNGADQGINNFSTELECLCAIDDLVSIGFERERLRCHQKDS